MASCPFRLQTDPSSEEIAILPDCPIVVGFGHYFGNNAIDCGMGVTFFIYIRAKPIGHPEDMSGSGGSWEELSAAYFDFLFFKERKPNLHRARSPPLRFLRMQTVLICCTRVIKRALGSPVWEGSIIACLFLMRSSSSLNTLGHSARMQKENVVPTPGGRVPLNPPSL